jgi:hypothetical protein
LTSVNREPWTFEYDATINRGEGEWDLSNGRAKAPVPKEHGAWFMLGHCLIIGAAVSGVFRWPVLLVIAASFLVFLSMQGLKQLARGYRSREHGIPMRVPWPSVAFLVGAALLGGIALIAWELDVLLLWGGVSLVLTLMYTWVLFKRKDRSLLGEWIGIAGLTVSTAVVWSAGTGTLAKEAFLLWIVAFTYFGGTVPYVKLRVKQMKSKGLSLPDRLEIAQSALVYTALSLVAVTLAAYQRLLPWLVIVPFGLSLSKVIWAVFEDRGPKKIAHIGYSEAVLSTVFAILTIAGFWTAR